MNIQVHGVRFRVIEFTESADGHRVDCTVRPPWGWRRRRDLDPICQLLGRHFMDRIGGHVDARFDAWWEGKCVVFSFSASDARCCATSPQ